MVHTVASLNDSLDALAAVEPGFARAIDRHGRPEPRLSETGVATLMRTIIGQQVSVAAARSMWAKLEGAFGTPPDLERLFAASDEELRSLGQSRQKASYLRSLAGLVLSGELDLANLPDDDEQAIELLTKVKGHRPLVGGNLSAVRRRPRRCMAGGRPRGADRGRAAARAGRATVGEQLRTIAEAWRPHRGAAAVLAWHSYNAPPL
jgi:DNA-3-methyladenine glycosylase II